MSAIVKGSYPSGMGRFGKKSVEHFKAMGYTDAEIGAFFGKTNAEIRYFRRRHSIGGYYQALREKWREGQVTPAVVPPAWRSRGWKMAPEKVAERYGSQRYQDVRVTASKNPAVVNPPRGDGKTLGGVSSYE